MTNGHCPLCGAKVAVIDKTEWAESIRCARCVREAIQGHPGASDEGNRYDPRIRREPDAGPGGGGQP